MKEYGLRYTTLGQIRTNHTCIVCNYEHESYDFCVNNCILMLSPGKAITVRKFIKLLNLIQEKVCE